MSNKTNALTLLPDSFVIYQKGGKDIHGANVRAQVRILKPRNSMHVFYMVVVDKHRAGTDTLKRRTVENIDREFSLTPGGLARAVDFLKNELAIAIHCWPCCKTCRHVKCEDEPCPFCDKKAA